MLQSAVLNFNRFLNRPNRVFLVCLAFTLLSLLLSGSLIRLWGLHRDHDRLTIEISETNSAVQKLQQQLKLTKDPAFIERQARERFDLADEHDLIFMFSDE